MTRKTKLGIGAALVISIIAVLIAGGVWRSLPETRVAVQGVTNLDSLHLSDTGLTATPVLRVDQLGAGEVAEFLDGGTPVFSISDGGGVVGSGSLEANTITAGTAFTLTAGKAVFYGVPDSDAANYDYMTYIGYYMTGTGTKDRNYGLLIEGNRPAGQEISAGDHDEAGLKIRVDTEAVTTTAGTVLRGADIEAKADNPDGTVSNLYGAAITAKSDTSAGSVDTMIALQTNAQNNALVTSTLMSADFRIMRQAATEPTAEYGVQVRSSGTGGSGADAAIHVTSDYTPSATTDSFDYGVDFSDAAINTAEIRGENGETIANTTDTAWVIGGFICATEGATIDLASGGIITPTATYQPITNATGGSIDTSATTAIADGPVAGAILILVNEDAQNIVIKDGANTILSGDITLTGGAMDTLTLIWNGSDWVGVSVIDN